MTISITLNKDSATFMGLDLKKVSLVIGAVSNPPMFYNFARRKAGVGEPGTNNKLLTVCASYPLDFEDHDFTLMGSQDPYHASRTLSLLIDLMRKDMVNVFHDGTEMTPEDILTFAPA